MVEFKRQDKTKSVLGKASYRSGGSNSNLEAPSIVIGKHKCNETDIFEVDESHVKVFGEGKRSNLTKVDIENVKQEDTPLAFFLKCLSNAKTFTYFLNQSTSKPINFKEGTALLREARISGKYDVALALERAGIVLEEEEENTVRNSNGAKKEIQNVEMESLSRETQQTTLLDRIRYVFRRKKTK